MPTLEHFALFAVDVHALKDFYLDAFGFRVVLDNSKGTPAGYFLADSAGMALELIGRPPGINTIDSRYICHVAISVPDLSEARAALERRNLVFEVDTVVETEAMQTAFFRDPEGNRVQIVHRARPLSAS